MKKLSIVLIFWMFTTSCGDKNLVAGFNMNIPFPDNFKPVKMELGEQNEGLFLLYDQNNGMTSVLLAGRKNYNTRSMFYEEYAAVIIRENMKWLKYLNWISETGEMDHLIEKRDLIFIRSLPVLSEVEDLPELNMYLNVDGNYGIRYLSGYSIDGHPEHFPMVFYAIHNKQRNAIMFFLFLKFKDGKGVPVEQYEDMMAAMEKSVLF